MIVNRRIEEHHAGGGFALDSMFDHLDPSLSPTISAIVVCPNPLPLPLHRWRMRVLGFEPIVRAAGSVGRAETLRHDAFQPELTGVPEHDVARLADTLVQLQAGLGTT